MIARVNQQTGRREILVLGPRGDVSHRYRVMKGVWGIAYGWSPVWRSCATPTDVPAALVAELTDDIAFRFGHAA